MSGVAAAAGDGHEAAPLRASASCYGSTCDGQDPIAAGCNADATTAEAVSTRAGRIELRYSRACGANWARLVNGAGYTFMVENATTYQFWTAKSSNSWGNMVDGTVQARACVWFDVSNRECTGWH
ncbi:DUF2690 domain-containing protein [Streptomyces sp. NPDC059104]|uniref:DUF2690 domain-containing protein n=1 Tax=Streptomyces sp. NPDC059104 TaxID=3346729 RepID=UPI0036CF8657